jgi:hypothetical protein
MGQQIERPIEKGKGIPAAMKKIHQFRPKTHI